MYVCVSLQAEPAPRWLSGKPYRARIFRKARAAPPGPDAPTSSEIDNKIVQAALGKGELPAEAGARIEAVDGGALMTGKAAPRRANIKEYIETEFDFSTDFMTASRYQPLFRRAARAIVRYREKLNEARARVASVSIRCYLRLCFVSHAIFSHIRISLFLLLFWALAPVALLVPGTIMLNALIGFR